jgi:hypothetical protein
MATGYVFDVRDSIHGRGKRFSLSPQCPDRLWGPPSVITNGYFFLELKKPERESHCTASTSAEITMVELYLHSL